jgi:hypothetical protein
VDTLPEFTSFPGADGKPVLEVLANGRQAVVHPSVIVDREGRSEQKRWFASEEPATVPSDTLLAAARKTAVLAVLATVWPASGRHNASLSLAGGLLRAGWSVDDVVRGIDALGWETQEPGELERLVESTAQRLDDDEPTTGWRRFAELTAGPEAVAVVCRLLGIRGFDPSDSRPRVRVRVGDLDKISDEAWAALVEVNERDPTLFRRSNRPVRVERIDDSDQVIVRELNEALLRYHAADALAWYKLTGEGEVIPASPPPEVIRNLLAYEDIPLPVLSRVVTAPVFSPEGMLQTAPGFHRKAKVYYAPPQGLTLPAVPANPNGADVAEAKRLLLEELLGDFPFVDQADRAHALALLLLPFVRDMISGPTPLHMIEAATPGTGKGLLVRVVSSVFTGGSGASETTLPENEDETRKKIFALLLESQPYILLDNINRRIDSSALASATTSELFTDRKLGVSEARVLPVRCAWVATGNNPVMTAEVARRTVRCRLVANVETPHLRPPSDFKHPELKAWAARHRGQLIWAALTLGQTWVAEGRPTGPHVLGSYESWAGTMGGILDAVGVAGFLGNVEDFYAEANDEAAVIAVFVQGWWRRHGTTTQTPSALLNAAQEAEYPFRFTDIDRQREQLGKDLKRLKDTIHAGFAIRKGTAPRGARSGWFLEPREGQVWTPPEPSDLGRALTVPVATSPASSARATSISR